MWRILASCDTERVGELIGEKTFVVASATWKPHDGDTKYVEN